MPYSMLIIADGNVTRFWDSAQLSRPQLTGVTLKPVSCTDTLANSLSEVNDGFDFTIISVLTTLLLEEASAADLRGASLNICHDVVRRVSAAAKRASKVEVRVIFKYFYFNEFNVLFLISDMLFVRPFFFSSFQFEFSLLLSSFIPVIALNFCDDRNISQSDSC